MHIDCIQISNTCYTLFYSDACSGFSHTFEMYMGHYAGDALPERLFSVHPPGWETGRDSSLLGLMNPLPATTHPIVTATLLDSPDIYI